MNPEQPVPPGSPVPGPRIPPPGPPTGRYPMVPWPPHQPPPPRRTVTVPFYVIPLAAALMVCALLATGLVTAAVVGGGAKDDHSTAAGATPSVAGSPSSQPSASPTTSANPLLDACVIGTWVESSHEEDGSIGPTTVRFIGKGAVQQFYDDGTAFVDFGSGVVYAGKNGADTWTLVNVGALNFHWQTGDGAVHYTNSKGDATQTLQQNGQTRQSEPLNVALTEKYQCAGNSLREFGDGFTVQLTRAGTNG
jgi:hypothetical protein